MDCSLLAAHSISISDEKPGPWRRRHLWRNRDRRLISISDEKPGPWRLSVGEVTAGFDTNFNLRREARPLATKDYSTVIQVVLPFQSQTRSQAPGDH